MLRKISLLLVILSLLLSACNSKTFNFFGESENWSAKLKVIQNNEDYEEQEFELSYKGNDVNSVGKITYNIDTNAGGFGGSGLTLDENGILKGSDEANPTNAKIIENSEMKVTVEWNGNTETITLSNN